MGRIIGGGGRVVSGVPSNGVTWNDGVTWNKESFTSSCIPFLKAVRKYSGFERFFPNIYFALILAEFKKTSKNVKNSTLTKPP